jgi:hypothetical protein
VQTLWEKYREEEIITPSIITTSYDAAAAAKSKALEKEPDIFDQIAQDLTRRSRPASQDEYQDYTNHFDQIDLGKLPAVQ